MDPFELASEHSMGYQQWFLDRMFMIAPAAAIVGRELQTLRDYPPRQRPGSFSLDNVMESIMSGIQP
jgi:arylsulfatase